MTSRLLRIDVSSWASIANLGAGYDCLALAVDLANRFTLYVKRRPLEEGEKEFEIRLRGDYASAKVDPRLATLDGNLFVQSFRYVARYLCADRKQPDVPRRAIMLCQEVSIPPMRGLGSSSSACVAGVVAAIHFLHDVFPDGNFLRTLDDVDLCASLAMETDNCPDNICACLAGGLTYSFVDDDSEPKRLHFFRQEIDDPDLRIVALVPSKTLGTPDARNVLDKLTYSCADAAFNICRSTCIPAVFRDRRYTYLREVLKDRIHQRQRAEEFYRDGRGRPVKLNRIFDEVIRAGAYAACVSGSGSTLVAFTDTSKLLEVKAAFQKAFGQTRLNWSINRMQVLTPSNERTKASTSLDPKGIPKFVSTWLNRQPGEDPGNDDSHADIKSAPEIEWPPDFS